MRGRRKPEPPGRKQAFLRSLPAVRCHGDDGWMREAGAAISCSWRAYSPKGFSLRRGLLVAVLSYLIFATRRARFPIQPTSPWHADFKRRGLAKPGHRGKRQKRAGGACSRPSGSSFSLPRGAFTNSAFRFYSIDFYVTHRFFVTFFPEESNVSLVPPFPSPPILKERIITYDAG